MKMNFLEYAQQQKLLQGIYQITALPRLHDALLELAVPEAALATLVVKYELQALPERHLGEDVLPALGLDVSVQLPLVCQRCFEAMPLSLDLHFAYVVCTTPPEALLEDDAWDWLDPAEESSLPALVEDELLMALPIAVSHEFPCVELQREAGDKPNPFAVLAKLKKSVTPQ